MRPIALYNVLVKIITKAAANRLKKLMPTSVTSNQCSFVAGRQLHQIMWLSSRRFYILWGGKRERVGICWWYRSWEGLRSDKLDIPWKCIGLDRVGNSDYQISYTLYEFIIHVCLMEWGNTGKIWTKQRASRGWTSFALSLCLMHIRFLARKFKVRQSGWKSRILSKAAKSILIQTTTSAIPFYTMQALKMPYGVTEWWAREVKSEYCFWGHEQGVRRSHTLAWDKFCRLKDQGGLTGVLQATRD